MKNRVNEGMKELKDSRNNSDYQKENLKKYDSKKTEDHIARKQRKYMYERVWTKKEKGFLKIMPICQFA